MTPQVPSPVGQSGSMMASWRTHQGNNLPWPWLIHSILLSTILGLSPQVLVFLRGLSSSGYSHYHHGEDHHPIIHYSTLRHQSLIHHSNDHPYHRHLDNDKCHRRRHFDNHPNRWPQWLYCMTKHDMLLTSKDSHQRMCLLCSNTVEF